MAKQIVKPAQPVVHDCRTCKHGGEEKNYMCFCKVLNVRRSVGIRLCLYYEIKKYGKNTNH